jgi:hypothetical protein
MANVQSRMLLLTVSQLNTRYFRGIEGAYGFELHFLLRKVGDNLEEYIVRAKASAVGSTNRSISAETHLDPGIYEVVPKILARRDPNEPPLGAIVRRAAEQNPSKLRQLGLNHDIAQSKALNDDEDAQPPELTGVVDLGGDNAASPYSSGFFCDLCMAESDSSAIRIHCLECEDYDLCLPCFQHGGVSRTHQFSHRIVRLEESSAIAKKEEENPSNEAPYEENQNPIARSETAGFICDVCNEESNMSASHVRCQECEDYFLCIPCYRSDRISKTHETKHEVHQVEGVPERIVNIDAVAADGEAVGDVCPQPGEVPPEVQARYMEMMREKQEAQYVRDSIPSAEPHDNPWNAVCVVGLRVYSKQAKMKISLVKPGNMAEMSMLDAGGHMPVGPNM